MEEQTPATLPPIKITLSPDDFKEISNALKSLADTDRQRLGDAIRDQDTQTLTAADVEFINIVAYFAKITTQRRDRELIKNVLQLDDPDIVYLVANAAPPDGVLQHITNPETERDVKPEELAEEQGAEKPPVQGELFPDLPPDTPPTLIVNFNERHVHSDKVTLSISKVSQTITDVLNRDITSVTVSPRKAKKPIYTKVTLSIEPPEGIQIKHPITFYDRIVEDAIGNLFEQGFCEVTPEIVYRQINGITGEKAVSKTAAAKIDHSIRRLARTWIEIDFTEQLKTMTRGDELSKGTIGDVILPAKNIYLRFANGTIKSGWQIRELPQIYKYSKIVKQVATIPTAILQTQDATRSTEETIAAKYYLIGQIERIKNKPENAKILFDSLFKATGDAIALENREIRRRRILAITAILGHFKQSGYITDYTITKEKGGKVDGVTINVSPRQIDTKKTPSQKV